MVDLLVFKQPPPPQSASEKAVSHNELAVEKKIPWPGVPLRYWMT